MRDFFSDFNSKYFDKFIDLSIGFLEGIAILVIGFWLARIVSKYAHLGMQKRGVEDSIRLFLKDIIQITLNILVIVIAINTVGIKVTSILALIGGAAVGVGLGLQGSFSNLASGVMIILTNPFRVGDLIKSENFEGIVEKINLLNTSIRGQRNELIVIPNAPLFNTTLQNFSSKSAYRIDITVGVENRSDLHKLRPILIQEISKNPMFLDYKPIVIEIEEFTPDRIHLTVRAYSKPKFYWDAPLILRGICKDTIETNGFKIPVAPREIKIINQNDGTTERH
ncbi:MAG TPA: mechanosensitive ion channel family protein [Moheibacter sp.]|nr:mechanosensitive ion channel family protein [Moheibacter sp.]